MLDSLKNKIINKTPLKKLVSNLSLNQVHEYWKTTDDRYNSPETYLNSSTDVPEIIFDLIKRTGCDKNSTVLDLGCNVGRNMNYLFVRGYEHLSGIDISKRAIDLMQKSFPIMAKSSSVYNDSFENILPNTKNLKFDIVFTSAVLMHIHKDSEYLLDYIPKLVNKFLITFEDEVGVARKNFPRNYKSVFEKLGMKQIFEMQSLSYVGRIFQI